MVGLAKALNMDVLAEGVETNTQEKMLLEVGVEKVQGFAYAKPMPEHDFLLLLKNQKPH
jgi:sensor c-di-GMP phosphodiesterase-like protein